MNANERTFQGELLQIVSGILSNSEQIKFSKITQEENIGTKGKSRFADGLLYSSENIRKIVSFELKNSKWDATDETLVRAAAEKANDNGYQYFVTGTPRQLVVYKTFIEGVPLNERKLKIYPLSNVKNDNDVLSPSYEKEVTPKLKVFLSELSDLVHGVKEVHWDSIDAFFVNKLSAYILEASAEMFEPMSEKITKKKAFREELKAYLKTQDIFNVTLNFDSEDIYKICQLSNYLLYLKVIFYSYLQRDVPALKLKPLEIPLDTKLLNKALRDRFNDVLKHDFEMIFSENIFDRFEFEQKYLPVFRDNVEQIKHLDFKDLSADIIGAIYNTLIDNQEQHDRGQHFTNTNEVDIVNAFCIDENTEYVIDTSCGAGTFLVRGYFFLKNYRHDLDHQKLLERVWGIEIAPFPVFLSVMNLSLLDIKTFDNYPVIINSDFVKVSGNYAYNGIFLNANKTFEVTTLDEKKSSVKLPVFDACVGNPPYIMQELIYNKEEWNTLIRTEFGITKINQQSDLYVYYLMHTAALLREGGRLGYVISASWLDVSFGAGLQKFLLDNFKIIAIIDQQKKRSFETASINTVILIVEKCSNIEERRENNIKFVRIFADYEEFIGRSSDADRFDKTTDFVGKIENASENFSNAKLKLEIRNQAKLEQLSTFNNKYHNGYWGAKFLRSSEIYKKIAENSQDKFIPLSEIAEVKYGIKTGANAFFYLIDETEKALAMSDELYLLTFGIEKRKHSVLWKTCGWYLSELNNQHYIIEKEYVSPIFKTQKEAVNLDVDLNKLKYCVLTCKEPKLSLIQRNRYILKYINVGESNQYSIPKIPSVSGREPWYDLTSSAYAGDFIFPSKIGEKYRLIDNRDSQVYCDKVNYVINIKDEYKEFSNEIFLLLNSICFRYFIDLFSRQLTGNQTLSDVDVNLVQKTLILRPELFREKLVNIKEVLESLKGREQGTIHEEILKDDKFAIDSVILATIGLGDDDVKELHRVASKYVKERQDKSASLTTSKSKQKLNYEDSLRLIKERFSEIRKYKNLVKNTETIEFEVPFERVEYPKNGMGSDNLFGDYKIYFVKDGKEKSISFLSPQQLDLFEFFNKTLEVKGKGLKLPKSRQECTALANELMIDYDANINSIRTFLKSNRSTANALSIYRDILFS